MCGLAGVMGQGMTLKHRETFKDLLYMSALRGREGTGVLAVNTRSNPATTRIFKSTRESNEFLWEHGHSRGFLSSGMWDIMMGHCRWPTKGAVSHKNVHPFDVGPFVGAHNGTLESDQFFSSKMTDSEMMFRLMVTKGMIPTLGDTSWFDAWAVSIYEKATQKIYLGTNGQRELCFGIAEDADVLFWASETFMLYAAAERNKVPLKVYRCSSYKLYEIGMDDVKAGAKAWISHEIDRPQVYQRSSILEFPQKGTKNPSLDDAIPF